MRFIKYFLLACAGQVVFILTCVALLEFGGIEFMWTPLLVLYISVADKVILALTGGYKGADAITTLVAGIAPFAFYSGLIACLILAWKRIRPE